MQTSSIYIHATFQDHIRILDIVIIFQSDFIFTSDPLEHLKNTAFPCCVAKSDGSGLLVINIILMFSYRNSCSQSWHFTRKIAYSKLHFT